MKRIPASRISLALTSSLLVALLSIQHPAHAEPSEPEASETPLAPSPIARDHLIIHVNGIVCSFCAHGLEKALARLPGLDGERYGNGVLVEIESQLVTLTFEPGVTFPFAEVHRRIKKAGYDPTRFDFSVTGTLSAVDSGWRLDPHRSNGTATRYLLTDPNGLPTKLLSSGLVTLSLSLDASIVADEPAGDIVPVRVYGQR